MMDFVGSQLSLIKVVFGIELFLAEIILCTRLKKKRHFGIRMSSVVAISLLMFAVFPVPIALADRFGALYGIFMYSSFYFITVISLMICYQENIWSVLFISSAAYTIEHIASSVNSIFNLFDQELECCKFQLFGISVYRIITYIVSLIVIYALAYWFIAPKLQVDENMQFAKKTIIFLCISVIIVDHGFVLLYYELVPGQEILDWIFIYVFNIICCILILATQISVYEHSKNLREFAVMDKLWKQAQQQYKVSKENIDAINMKCHDMKHLVHKMEQEHNAVELKDIYKILDSYDVGVETGNEILNVILTEKAFYCQKNQIQFTCIVNGEILNFIEHTDLYVLFGNIVDNCIHAVRKLEDKAQKIISLNVKQEKGFVIISTENFYKAQLEFADELPVTTNEDKMNHGYGMRSIQSIVTKYNGQMSIIADGEIFDLSILIPIPKEQKKTKK